MPLRLSKHRPDFDQNCAWREAGRVVRVSLGAGGGASVIGLCPSSSASPVPPAPKVLC